MVRAIRLWRLRARQRREAEANAAVLPLAPVKSSKTLSVTVTTMAATRTWQWSGAGVVIAAAFCGMCLPRNPAATTPIRAADHQHDSHHDGHPFSTTDLRFS
jgi:hypothetical protein